MANAAHWSVFTTCPRSTDFHVFCERSRQTFALTQQAAFTGTLIYTGNDIPVEPWFLAHEVARDYPRLSPLVAVNPIYMHPFTVARHISAIAWMCARRCHLNLVAGTSLHDLRALDSTLDHDQRYIRLREFADIVIGLCSTSAPFTYDGEHLGVNQLQLRPPVPPALRPRLFVAGQSPPAVETAARLGACNLGMLQPDFAMRPPGARGVHLGLICRDTDEEAWRAAHERFPPDAGGERMQRFSAQNTDAVWKAQLLGQAARADAPAEYGYWLDPFRRGQADCAMLVGGRRRIVDSLRQLGARGVDQFVLELAPHREDYDHVVEAFAGVQEICVVPGDHTERG